ncbi:MAG: agmatine deiminase family protein [Bacteroidota bacterium]
MTRYTILFFLFLLFANALHAQDVVLPAEFEKNEGIMLKWNYNAAIDSTLVQIASIISADDKVWILYDPSSAFTTAAILEQLAAGGATAANIIFLEGTAETPWLRDYGPAAGYYEDGLNYNRHFEDAQYKPSQFPLADFLPVSLASYLSFTYNAMPLNFEYGNLALDGIGRGFVGDRVLTENPGLSKNEVMQGLYTNLSLNEIIILPSVNGCGGGEWGEISRLLKFVDPETVLVSQLPESAAHHAELDMIADTLSKTVNDVGKYFQVVRLPVAPGINGGYSVSDSGEVRSYTSSILFNNKIFIPSYNTATDATALCIYKQLFSGYQVVQVPSQILTALHGSLYRLALIIPQPKLFRIRHSKITGLQDYQSEIWINTFVQSIDPIDSIQLYYRIHPSSAFQAVSTTGCCGGNSGLISGFGISDTISYYIQAYGGNHVQTLPLAAPEAVFTFWFDPYTNSKETLLNQQIQVSPNPTSGTIFIRGTGLINQVSRYQVINLFGITEAEGEIHPETEIRLPANLADGYYMIKISGTFKTFVSKLYLHR